MGGPEAILIVGRLSDGDAMVLGMRALLLADCNARGLLLHA